MTADTIPDDTAAHYSRLINEAEKMRKAAADALKDAYADLRSDLKELGWEGKHIAAEVAAFKGAIAEMNLAEAEKQKRDVKGDRIDQYVFLLSRARAPARENIEEFDPITGEFLEEETQERLSNNDEASPEAGPQAEASPAGTGTGTLADREGRHEGEEASVVLPTNSPETANEMDREEMRVDEVGHSLPAENARKAMPETERGDVSHAGAGEIPATRSDGGLNIVHKHTEIASGDNTVTYESVPPRPMKTLAYAHCFPELSKTAYQCLAGDIALNGVLEPIIRHGDVIIDGWSRYNAARSLGIEYPVIRYSGNDVLIDVIGWQRSSRDWTPAQERKIATTLAKELPDRADDIWAAFHQAETSEDEGVVAA